MEFDFSEVDSLDKVPSDFRPLYGDKPNEGGMFQVSDTFTGVAASISGFNRTLKQLRQDMKTNKVDLSPLQEFGSNPDEIKEAFSTRLTEMEASYKKTQNSDTAKQIEAVKSALQEAHGKEMAKASTMKEALSSQLYTLLVENKATTAIAEAKGTPELLMPFIKTQVQVVEEEGKMQEYVYDDAKNIRYGNTGSPMTVGELVAEMKGNPKYGKLFDSEQMTGGGAMPGAARKAPAQKGQVLSSSQKISAGLAARSK